jgi:endonuclease YncB( thermonuclease family)
LTIGFTAVAKAIFQLKSGRIAGTALLGAHGDVAGSVDQETHDGDTVNVRADGNFGVRFLGVDAPEISFTLPGESTNFQPIGSDGWKEFLTDPFAAKYGEFEPPLTAELRAHIEAHVGAGTAENHERLAKAAQEALKGMINEDIQALQVDPTQFRFFLAFANEVMDGYGRMLCYLNRDQAHEPPPRPKSYNERLLAVGAVTPYFIWPNLDPYKRPSALVDAVPEPGSAVPAAAPPEATKLLKEARESVRAARENHLGVFEQADPLRLYPFELRYLARRKPPDRWVIDLGAGDDVIHKPQQYPSIAAPEDRLFIPAEYVPLFVSKGWNAAA